ncbi:hypothetical protein HW988_13975 [Bdellovibrio sp. KM01]|nr:hypothetical protein HW988_13975 [Bdellovibrio sp. KM01]
MEITKLYKRILAGTLCISLLSGFTGKEEYVELKGMLNGRSSGSFTRGDNNIVTTLTRGTRGEILETKKLRSGSFGIKIKVLNGRSQGEEMWVYHKEGASDLSLFAEMPSNWNQARTASSVSSAKAARVETDKPAIADPESSKKKSARTVEALEAVNKANKAVKKSNCTSCSVAAAAPTTEGQRSTIAPERTRYSSRGKALAKRTIPNACMKIMNTQGRPGALGQKMISLMSRPGYKEDFTSSNALGTLCPRFNSLSDQNKLLAWTWFWTALAREENVTCNASTEHGETYVDRSGRTRILNPDIGIGLWTMEKSAAVRRENGRGPECRSVSTAEGQARCAISIMRKDLVGSSNATSPGSYWGPLRGKRVQRQMMPHMERFRLCFQK